LRIVLEQVLKDWDGLGRTPQVPQGNGQQEVGISSRPRQSDVSLQQGHGFFKVVILQIERRQPKLSLHVRSGWGLGVKRIESADAHPMNEPRCHRRQQGDPQTVLDCPLDPPGNGLSNGCKGRGRFGPRTTGSMSPTRHRTSTHSTNLFLGHGSVARNSNKHYTRRK